jgi:peptidoglycan/LPS O-acetylase OafA/YrhL
LRPNNFDLARLILATNVLLFHCYALSNSPKLHIFKTFNFGNWAVEGFFAISGLLIFASYDRSRSLRDYFEKRARRIIPAYLVSTFLCIGIAVYFTHAFHVGKFLLANLSLLTFLHPGIAGVFEHNPENSMMNGALWTIKVEVMFYLSVPLLIWLCRRFGRLPVLISCGILSLVYHYVTVRHESLMVQLPGQVSFFIVGALIYYYLPAFKRWGYWLMAFAGLALVAYVYTGYFFLKPLSIPLLVLGFSLLVPEIKGPTRWGDFSYGTYVLHWPIIQTLVAVGVFKRPWVGVASAITLVGIAAVISWYTVEERALGRRKHSEKPRMVEPEAVAQSAAQSAR